MAISWTQTLCNTSSVNYFIAKQKLLRQLHLFLIMMQNVTKLGIRNSYVNSSHKSPTVKMPQTNKLLIDIN